MINDHGDDDDDDDDEDEYEDNEDDDHVDDDDDDDDNGDDDEDDEEGDDDVHDVDGDDDDHEVEDDDHDDEVDTHIFLVTIIFLFVRVAFGLRNHDYRYLSYTNPNTNLKWLDFGCLPPTSSALRRRTWIHSCLHESPDHHYLKVPHGSMFTPHWN